MQYAHVYCSGSLYASSLCRLTSAHRHPLRARQRVHSTISQTLSSQSRQRPPPGETVSSDRSIAAKPYAGGPQPTLQASHHAVLRELVEADNDATLAQLAERLGERTGVFVSGSTISRMLGKLDITRKKSFKVSEVYSAAKQQQRRDYWQSLRDVAAEDLVFLDETGVNLAMVSLSARAQRGQRAYAQQSKGRGKTLTMLGAMSLKAGFL